MTYNVFGGPLNLAQSINQSIHWYNSYLIYLLLAFIAELLC